MMVFFAPLYHGAIRKGLEEERHHGRRNYEAQGVAPRAHVEEDGEKTHFRIRMGLRNERPCIA